MKKAFFVSVLMLIIVGGIFALPSFKLSSGVGGYFTSDFGGGYDYESNGTYTVKMPYSGGGGFVFIDATFVEWTFGFFGGSMKMEETYHANPGGTTTEKNLSPRGLDFGLLLKYPLGIDDTRFLVFPLFGVNYRLMLSAEDEDKNNIVHHISGTNSPHNLSALWFRLGGGLDFHFIEHIFMRGEILYGFRLANHLEQGTVDHRSSESNLPATTLLGHGLDIKLAVGYRF